MVHTFAAKRRFGALLAALVLLPLLPLPASAAEPAATTLSYRVYAGGLHLLDATLLLRNGQSGYRARLEAASAGAVEWFAPFTFEAEAEGARRSSRLMPHSYEAVSRREGKETRRLTIRYDGSRRPQVMAEPPRDDIANSGLSAAERANTYDPLSGLFQLLDAALAGGACGDEVAIFDGKRRLEMRSEDEGEVSLSKSRYNLYDGPARRCLIKVADIRAKDLDARKLKRIPRRLTIFMASPAPGLPPLPVRAEVDSVIGTILLHLAAVTPPGRDRASLK